MYAIRSYYDAQDLSIHLDVQILAANACDLHADHESGLGLEDVDVGLPAVA